MNATEQETAEDVAWLRQQMQLGYRMAGRYKSALEVILADCKDALAKQEPHLYSVALRSACLEAQEALDDTWGIAARPAPAPPAEGGGTE